MFCREQVAELRPHIPEIRAAGAELFVIGSGAPMYAADFKQQFQLAGTPIWTDEPLAAYALLEFKRRVSVSFALVKNVVRGLRSGARQGRTQGDAMQLGGVVVVRPGGEIVYLYRSREAGDHPDPREIVAALSHRAA